jgi:glutathione S-transferase
MSNLRLYGHPFSSYTWKALIALHEKGLPFEFRMIDAEHPENAARLAQLWPLEKFPVLEDGDAAWIESSILIEHLDLRHSGRRRLLPADPAEALKVRFMDRVFDNHVMGMVQAIVSEYLPFLTPTPDPSRIERAKASLSTVYAWLDVNLPEENWACGDEFTLADCAGAPALFYADWVHGIPKELTRLKAYRARLLSRPSVASAVDGGRPYRPLFPLGAPDRD